MLCKFTKTNSQKAFQFCILYLSSLHSFHLLSSVSGKKYFFCLLVVQYICVSVQRQSSAKKVLVMAYIKLCYTNLCQHSHNFNFYFFRNIYFYFSKTTFDILSNCLLLLTFLGPFSPLFRINKLRTHFITLFSFTSYVIKKYYLRAFF